MSLPAFATIEDLDARLPGGVAAEDEARAQAALDDASALMRVEASKSWVTDDELDESRPDILLTICVRAAMRSFVNPEGVIQDGETAGPYNRNRTFANSSSDVYLTAAEKAQVRAAAGKPALSTISTTRGLLETQPVLCGPGYEAVSDSYVPVDPPGQDLPFLDAPWV